MGLRMTELRAKSTSEVKVNKHVKKKRVLKVSGVKYSLYIQ